MRYRLGERDFETKGTEERKGLLRGTGGGAEKGKGGKVSDDEEVDEVEEEEIFEKYEGAAMNDAGRGAASCEVFEDVAGACDAASGVRTSSDAAGAVAASERKS